MDLNQPLLCQQGPKLPREHNSTINSSVHKTDCNFKNPSCQEKPHSVILKSHLIKLVVIVKVGREVVAITIIILGMIMIRHYTIIIIIIIILGIMIIKIIIII